MVKGTRAVTLDSLIESVWQGPAVIMCSRWPLHLATSSVATRGSTLRYALRGNTSGTDLVPNFTFILLVVVRSIQVLQVLGKITPT